MEPTQWSEEEARCFLEGMKFHNVYIDPDSWAHWKRTGEFREGTILVKELISVGSKVAVSGNGYFMGEYIGLEATIKSKEHFASEPGSAVPGLVDWTWLRSGREQTPCRTISSSPVVPSSMEPAQNPGRPMWRSTAIELRESVICLGLTRRE